MNFLERVKIFETIFYQSTDGILIIEDGKFVECNDAVVKMLKYKSKNEFLDSEPAELSPEYQPDGRKSSEKVEENTRVVLEKGSRSFEWVHKKATGEEFWVEVVLTDISRTKEQILFLVVWRDIDKKKKNEEKLKELNENLENEIYKRTRELAKLSGVISHHVIYSKTNLSGIITEVSEAFCTITGYSEDELIGHSHNIIRHKDMPSSLYEELWTSLLSTGRWRGNIKNLKKDGGFYWVDSHIVAEYDEEGNKTGYISIRHDITSKMEVIELNKTLEHRIQKEVEHNRIKDMHLLELTQKAQMGEMIENISHQWKHPLSYISAATTKIATKQALGTLDNSDIEEGMTKINEYTQHLSSTIDVFRNYLRESKKSVQVILQENINNTLNIMNVSLHDNYIKLIDNINYANPIKVTMIMGELSQVIINIINNAQDALIEKKIADAWIKIDLEENKDKLVITIEDNAGGIPDEIISKVFNQYFTTKDKSNGTGLGLNMSYKMVCESLKGNLYVKNTQNGAKFFIELPR